MSLIKSFKDMEKSFAWSFLGFVVAIVFGLITIYLEFIKESRPDLNYIISANSSVLDVKEKLGSLEVLYQGESLSKSGKDLRLITFKVINQGDSIILSNYYDENDPVGFSVANGILADSPTLMTASNQYLKDKLIITETKEGKVLFSNVILEPGEFFELKILVLHSIKESPELTSFGKIASVNRIDILQNFSEKEETSMLADIYGGGILINLARVCSYGILFFFILFIVFSTGEKISEIIERRRKEKILTTFKEYDSDKVTEKDNFFFDYYLSDGAAVVRNIEAVLTNNESLNYLYEETKDRKYSKKRRRYFGYSEEDIFIELRNEGFVTIEADNIEVDHQRLSVLRDFVSYLKRKGEFKRDKYSRNFEIEESIKANVAQARKAF